MIRRLATGVAILVAGLGGGGCIAERIDAPPVAADGATRTGFLLRTVTLPDGSMRKYSVYVPHAYDPRKAWPTIVFLQGLGEGGTDGVRQTSVGLGPYIRKHAASFDMLAVFPQSGGRWTSDDAEQIAMSCLDDAQRRYNVDASRVYLTGTSMGGYGAWRIGGEHAERFAAVVPMCGFDGTEYAARLAKTPVWAFHNTFDPIVFSWQTRATVDAINAAGGNALVTIYGTVGHNCWDRAFNERDFWPWLRRQSKKPTTATAQPPVFRGLAK